MNKIDKIVKVEGVWKRFGGVVVNENIHIEVGVGEIVSILGPNGAGKTTLLRQIYGELRPDAGVIHVLGMAPHRARRLGAISAVPQEATPFNMLRVDEHIEFLVRLRGVPKSRARGCVEEALSMAGLKDYRRRLVYELSGGMRRLVLVASALSCRPKLVLLDEPTVGIDVQNRRRIWDSVKAAKEVGASAILTTHYIHEAEELSDRVYLMNRAVLMEGPPGELKKRLNWVEIRDERGGRLRLSWEEAMGVVLKYVEERRRFELREPGLEDIFLEAVGGRT